MARHNNRLVTISAIAVFGLVGIFGYRLYYDHGLQYPKSIYDFNETGDYIIDPQIIISEIDQGRVDVFQPMNRTTDVVNTVFPTDKFKWSQSDYLKVANALHRFVWDVPVDSWYIFGMEFFRECQDNPVGLGSAYITYYKFSDQYEGYTVHELDIYPSGSGVSWGGGDGWPRPLFGWRSINLSRLKVTANDALRSAEEYGGIVFRAQLKNECEIHISLKPTITGNNWTVSYFADTGASIFEYRVAAYVDLD